MIEFKHEKWGITEVVLAILLVLIIYSVGFLLELSQRDYDSNYIVYEKNEKPVYICDEVRLTKYYIDGFNIIDLETGIEYDKMNDCKETK